jgi:outer membrane protein
MKFEKMKRLKLSLILLLGVGVFNGYAQTELTLQQCLQYALSNNQKLAQTRMEEDLGRLKTSEIRAQALPQVNGNAKYTDNIKLGVLPISGEKMGQPEAGTILMPMGMQHNVTAGADLSQQIYNQSVFTGLKAARSGEEYYRLQTAQTEEGVIYNVTQLYYQTLVTREKMIVLDANIDKISKLLEATASQVKNGLAKKIDEDRMKVNLTNYKTQRTQLLNELQVRANQLKQSMGMAIESDITLPRTSFAEIEKKTASAVDFGGMNLDNRIEYKLLKKQEELQGMQKKAYIAENYPSLSAFANYSYNGIGEKFDYFKSGSNSTTSWYSMAAVGLTLKIPIFDGFARRSRVRQADVTLRQINKKIEETTLSLNTAYANAKLQVQNNLSTIKSQMENVDLANEVYSSTQNNYNLGLANLTDLLEAETSLTAAQNNYNEALLQYKLAELDIIKSNGNLKTLLN